MISCPGCRQNLKFDIASQDMVCGYCDTHYDPYEVEKEEDAKSTEYFEATVFTCPQCGGELYSTENEATAFCIYCGGANILSERISKEKRPDYIIPFQKTKEDCKRAYVKKMRKAFFVPKEYKSSDFIDGFRGIYMPYWSYQMKQDTDIKILAMEKFRSGDYIVKNYYNLTGKLSASVDGIPFDASTSFYDDISQGLGMYDCRDQRVFSPSFLSGFYADVADVDNELYVDEAKDIVAEASLTHIKEEEIFHDKELISEEKDVKSSLQTEVVKIDRTMYPVWFMSYRNGDRVAYATVNGQTGKVFADMPVDKGKFLLSAFVIAVPLFLLYNLFLTLNPKECLTVCVLFMVISLALYFIEMRAIYKKEQFINDKAQMLKAERMDEYESKPTTSPVQTKIKKLTKDISKSLGIVIGLILFAVTSTEISFGFLVLPIVIIAAICLTCCVVEERAKLENPTSIVPVAASFLIVLLAGMVRLLNPVHDAWYYGVSIGTLLAVCVNFLECMNYYNYLATRKLPQFERKTNY